MNEKKSKTIKNRFSKLITKWMIVLSIIPLLLFGLFASFFILQSTKSTAENRLRESVQSFHSILAPQIVSYDEQIQLLSKDEQLINILNKKETNLDDINLVLNKMYTVLGTRSKDIALHLIDEDSSMNYSTQVVPNMYNPLLFKEWGVLRFAQNRTGHKIYPNHYQWDNGKVNSFSITRYVSDVDGQKLGLLIMDFSKDYIQGLVRSIETTQFGNVQFLFTSNNGTEIYNGTDIEETEIRVGSNFFKNNETILENEYTVSTYTESDLNIEIIGILSNDYLNTNIWLVGLAMLLTLIPTLLLAISLGFLVSNRIKAPILALASKVRQVRTSKEYTLTQINREDEVGIIDQAFADLLLRIDEYHQIDIEKREQLRIAEVKALQSQINPHFLYNTLDTIKWQAKLNNMPNIATMITELSTILQASMDFQKPVVSVREEIRLINSFIYIQKQRSGDAFQYQQIIESHILDYKIPKFLIQPLVENAVIHGLKNKQENGLIVLKGEEVNNHLIFIVEDNGEGLNVPLDEILNESNHSRVGLINVNKRIKLYYGQKYGLEYYRINNITQIVLKISNEVKELSDV